MNAKLRRKLARAKRRIEKRLDRHAALRDKHETAVDDGPVLGRANIHDEIADRTRGIAAGGMGLIQRVVKQVRLAERIDRRVHVLAFHAPYHESDHVLNIAYNILAGGTRLEHIELRRNDEVYLDALGARRIPDPTTAGEIRGKNANDWDLPAAEVVFAANDRCNQENHIEQLKNGVSALRAPLDSLDSNWACMVMAALAWSLKAWTALLLPDDPPAERRGEKKSRGKQSRGKRGRAAKASKSNRSTAAASAARSSPGRCGWRLVPAARTRGSLRRIELRRGIASPSRFAPATWPAN